MKFYPRDWLGDPDLQSCSLEARGLWIEMLCIMHRATPRGYLIAGGKPLTLRDLGRLISGTSRGFVGLLDQLLRSGVCSKTNDGTYFSAEMVQEEAQSLKNKENGLKGGNPSLKGRVNPPVNPESVNPEDNGRLKAHIPDTRDQKESKNSIPPAADSANGDGGSKYVYERGSIRLNARDYDRWVAGFPNLNLLAELDKLSGWPELTSKNWFHAVAAALVKRNQEVAEGLVAAKARGEATVNPKPPRRNYAFV